MTEPTRKLSEILKEMSERLYGNSRRVPSFQAAQVTFRTEIASAALE